MENKYIFQEDLPEYETVTLVEVEKEQTAPATVFDTILLEKPFNPAFINITTTTPSLLNLINRMAQNAIEMNTSTYFQRNPNLWDDVKKSQLIESILIRFPLPAFYFDGTDSNKWLVVDGLQRLSSIQHFVLGDLKLTGMEFLTQLNGKTYNDLDLSLQRLIEETPVVVYLINPGTPADVKFNIFKRINTGGLKLEAQEIRHALFQGIPAQFIAELAEMEEFKSATTGSIQSHRMLDRDFVNRFLAFYLFPSTSYQPDLDTFMSKAMARTTTLSETERQKIKSDFATSMVLNQQIFGVHAFRKLPQPGEKRKPLNKALFEVFSVLFAKLDVKQSTQLINQRKDFIGALETLMYADEKDRFFWAISSATGDRNRVHYRFSKIEELIRKFIDNDSDA
jgi:Protein of unknown function DUF262